MPDSTHQRPTKRSRTDASNAEPPTPERGDPWLDDGNIVLQAGSKQFRVLRSILSASSSIFSDMFSIPQPVDEKLVDGCPVVHVSDTAEDLHHVLKALFDRSYCSVDSEPLPLPVIAAFLRLGRKYDIPQLHSEALKRLTFEFPSTLEEYDRSRDEYTLIDHDDTDTLLLTVIHLARESDHLSILPVALYEFCGKFGVRSMIDFLQQSDGTSYAMCFAEQRLVIAGWESLVETQAEDTFAWLANEDIFKDICITDSVCAKNRNGLLLANWHPSPLCIALAPWAPHFEDDYCPRCIDKSKEIHNAGRQNVWNKLPSIFGLPGWEELKKPQ